MDYLLRCRVRSDQWAITNYYRGSQSLDAFRLALAAVGGLAITHYTQRLIAMRQQGAQTIYTFEYETLRTDYPHDLLTVGQVYPYSTIIGDGIKFFRDDGQGLNDWWRQIDWKGGIWLSPLVGNIPGLWLSDSDTIVYSAGSDSGSESGNKLHARIKLGPDFYNEQPYWNRVAEAETRSGNYINNLPMAGLPEDSGSNTFSNLMTRYAEANVLSPRFGWPTEQPDLESLSNRKLVNALDFYFRAVWQKRGVVITIDHTQIADLANFYRFMQREMPSGIMPLVLTYGLTLTPETMANGSTITFTDSVNITGGGYLTLTETVVLPSIMSDVGVRL